MARINKSQYALLSVLSRRDGLSGYDIKQIMNKVAAFFWSESNAQIYPMLKKLEQEQMVESELDEASGARQRRIYHITNKGREFLLQWLSEPCGLASYREELLLKLSAAQFLPREKVLEHIRDYQTELMNLAKQLRQIRQHVAERHQGRADQPFLDLTYEHASLVLEAKIKWCELALQKVSQQ